MTTADPARPTASTAGSGLADVWWKTGRVAVKAGGAETGGRFAQLEFDDPRGTAPPLHIHHDEDETFYVLDGEITIFADGERIDARCRRLRVRPARRHRTPTSSAPSARGCSSTFSPAGFEEVFVELGRARRPATTRRPPMASCPPPEEFARALRGLRLRDRRPAADARATLSSPAEPERVGSAATCRGADLSRSDDQRLTVAVTVFTSLPPKFVTVAPDRDPHRRSDELAVQAARQGRDDLALGARRDLHERRDRELVGDPRSA